MGQLFYCYGNSRPSCFYLTGFQLTAGHNVLKLPYLGQDAETRCHCDAFNLHCFYMDPVPQSPNVFWPNYCFTSTISWNAYFCCDLIIALFNVFILF